MLARGYWWELTWREPVSLESCSVRGPGFETAELAARDAARYAPDGAEIRIMSPEGQVAGDARPRALSV